MLYEDLRLIHEDTERLEQAIADRMLEDPVLPRDRLTRDHEIASFLTSIIEQSGRALQIYNDQQDARMAEIQSMSSGDTFGEFYRQMNAIRGFHKRNPNEPVENLEQAYNTPDKGGPPSRMREQVLSMFTGEEAFGRYFDLNLLHDEYMNLPGVRGTGRIPYLRYLDTFDKFTPPFNQLKKSDKLSEAYFSYTGSLSQYLESFMRKTKPLEELDKVLSSFDQEFEENWEKDAVPGWKASAPVENGGLVTEGAGTGVWCADCQKEFSNDNTYKAHLSGKKHQKNAAARQNGDAPANAQPATAISGLSRLKEKAIAAREYRIMKLAAAMQTIRADTRANVERRHGMTEKERQLEIAAQYADQPEEAPTKRTQAKEDEDEEQTIYNPLKLPLGWDGKPIPYWLYKLHGLGNEFTCEICGNHVYMGRRAFEKHFSEAKHINGLKCLGITSTNLFREITHIEEAQKLWEKLQRDRAQQVKLDQDVEEMEDSNGVVMPRKVWEDLFAEGLL